MEWLDSILAGNDIFKASTFREYWTGLTMTVQLTVLALIAGGILAIPLALMRSSNRWYLSVPVWFFTYVFRGTPLIVQLYIIYYGSSFTLQDTSLWFIFKEAFYPALIAFALNTAAYTTEILRGAIIATSHGEKEAARAYGMSWWTMTRRIVLPSALRRALPAYSNEVIFMLHATAIASTVTILDLTGAAYNIYSRYYAPFESFLFVAAIYMCLTFVILGVFRTAERRYLGHLVHHR